MTMLQKSSAAAMPTIVPGTTRRDCWIMVPGSDGWFVLRMLIGILARTAGMTASSAKTPNPAYASSRISRYVMAGMPSETSGTMRGSTG